MRTVRRKVLPDPWVPDLFYRKSRYMAGFSSLTGTVVSVANHAHYVPVWFPADATLYALSFAASNGTGNYDLGLYNAGLERLGSTGSTAMTATGVKTLTLPELRVQAGEVYYCALAMSSTSGAAVRIANVTGGWYPAFGWGMEASALPLPATATPVSTTAYSVVPVFAFGIR